MGASLFRNTRLLLMVLLLILAAGFSALSHLPRTEDPRLRGRYANVITRFPGADAERVELLVTEKIEQMLSEFEEIDYTMSETSAGNSWVFIELAGRVTEVELVWSKIRDRLDDLTASLPNGVSEPTLETARNMDSEAFTLLAALRWAPARPIEDESLDAFPHTIILRLAEELEDLLLALPGTRPGDQRCLRAAGPDRTPAAARRRAWRDPQAGRPR